MEDENHKNVTGMPDDLPKEIWWIALAFVGGLVITIVVILMEIF
ncbi:MAG TPA: hypothetical protein PKH50_01290 [bacterium]|jgi:hypothetical protein|nr:hypothetical protein [bacterium]